MIWIPLLEVRQEPIIRAQGWSGRGDTGSMCCAELPGIPTACCHLGLDLQVEVKWSLENKAQPFANCIQNGDAEALAIPAMN